MREFFEFPPEPDSSVNCWQSLCGLKMKMFLCQERHSSEEHHLQRDVRVFSSNLLAYVLNILHLCLPFIEAWILRCRTMIVLTVYLYKGCKGAAMLVKHCECSLDASWFIVEKTQSPLW